MKAILKLMVLAAIFLPAMLSCSGGSKTPLFGSLPEVYSKFQAENNALMEEAKNIKTDKEKEALIKKSSEMKEKWTAKIEESAKNLDGKPIEFAEGNFKVTQPISLQYDGFANKSKLTPKFNINGAAEAAADITTDIEYFSAKRTVSIVGYDAEGQEVFKQSAGSVDVENNGGYIFVPAGTPIVFSTLYFSDSKVDGYLEAKTIKLELLR